MLRFRVKNWKLKSRMKQNKRNQKVTRKLDKLPQKQLLFKKPPQTKRICKKRNQSQNEPRKLEWQFWLAIMAPTSLDLKRTKMLELLKKKLKRLSTSWSSYRTLISEICKKLAGVGPQGQTKKCTLSWIASAQKFSLIGIFKVMMTINSKNWEKK